MGKAEIVVDKQGFIRGSTGQNTLSKRDVGESMETESIPGIR